MESDIVRADDALPGFFWAQYFIEAQGFTVEEIITHQKNLSTMLLDKNGSELSTQRTKLI